jgi:hypothetical protein
MPTDTSIARTVYSKERGHYNIIGHLSRYGNMIVFIEDREAGSAADECKWSGDNVLLAREWVDAQTPSA